jgi:hypothetical protein
VDIWNAVAKIRRERKQGRSYTKTLIVELEEKVWISRPIYDEDELNRLLTIGFCYPRLLEYARLYCKVLILDCTFNTNSVEMLLFEAIRIDFTRKLFCV